MFNLSNLSFNLFQRLVACLRPTPEWGPALEEHRILYKKSLAVTSSRFPQKYFSGLGHSASNSHMVDDSGLCMVQTEDAGNAESSV